MEYDLIGTHAVPSTDADQNGIPDYVERAAEYAEASRAYLVDTLGYRDPVRPGLPYVIRFEQMGFYGYNQLDGAGNTYVAVHRNFEGFPTNDDPEGDVLGALKVTIAHELKHAIQYRYDFRANLAGTPSGAPWAEIDATAAEEIVYPQVNDYLNYLGGSSLSGAPGGSVPTATTQNAYAQSTFALYFHQRLSPAHWVAAWERVALQPNIPIGTWLAETNAGYWAAAFAEAHLWHYLGGTRALGGYGFPDAARFPTSQATAQTLTDPGTTLSGTLSARAARHHTLTLPAGRSGGLRVVFFRSQPDVEMAFAVTLTTGDRQVHVPDPRSDGRFGFAEYRLPYAWDDVAALGVVVANAASVSAEFAFRVETTTQPSGKTFGDVDLSGMVDVQDLQQALEWWTGARTWPGTDGGRREWALDGDGDGMATLADIGLLHRRVVWPDSTPFPSATAPVPGFSFAWPRPTPTPRNRPFAPVSPALSHRFSPEGDSLIVTIHGADPTRATATWGYRFALSDTGVVLFNRALLPDHPEVPLRSAQHAPDGPIAVVSPLAGTGRIGWNTPVELRFRVLRRAPGTTLTLLEADFGAEWTPTWNSQATLVFDADPMNPVGIEPIPASMPETISLLNAYPNPFNPSSVVSYRLTVDSQTRVAIHDVLGREVEVLFRGRLAAGTHRMTWDAGRNASGLYFVVVDAGAERRTLPITLLK